MKTAEEMLREKPSATFAGGGGGVKMYSRSTVIESMKEYAIEVAKEALKNASLRDGCIFADGERYVHHSLVADENNIPKL